MEFEVEVAFWELSPFEGRSPRLNILKTKPLCKLSDMGGGKYTWNASGTAASSGTGTGGPTGSRMETPAVDGKRLVLRSQSSSCNETPSSSEDGDNLPQAPTRSHLKVQTSTRHSMSRALLRLTMPKEIRRHPDQ